MEVKSGYKCQSHRIFVRESKRVHKRSEIVQDLWSVALDLAVEVLGLRREKITIRANMTGFRKRTHGYCRSVWETEMDKDLGLAPNEIQIAIKANLKMRSFVTALAHELEHARQYTTGELTGSQVYKGIDQNDTDYWNKAHEVAARAVEEPIWELFVERCADMWGMTAHHAEIKLEKLNNTW